MMEEQNGTKQLLITKEAGKKWTVDFTGKVSMRDMNQLRRILPVAFSRMKRSKRLDRAREERAETVKLARIPTVSKLTATEIVAKKESNDATVR